MRAQPLIPVLRGRAVAATEALALGVTPSRLRASDVAHPHHGVAAFGALDATLADRCRLLLPVLGGQVWFAGRTAAELWGMSLPRRAGGLSLEVAVLDPRTPPRRPGVRGSRVSDVRWTMLDGVPVLDPSDVWCSLGPMLSLEDLVAAGDSLLSARHRTGLVTLDELREASVRHRGKRGMRRVREAITLLRPGAESRPESLLRLLLVRSELPEPVIDHAVLTRSGLVLHPDLAYPQARVAIEYEGDGHRTDRRQWRLDLGRAEAFEDADWRRVLVTADDLFTSPDALVGSLRRLIASRAVPNGES